MMHVWFLQCYLFRRHPVLRMHFASAVGKRLFTERILATGKASLADHERTFGWSELEYRLLRNLIADGGGADIVMQLVEKQSVRSDPMVEFVDYVGLVKKGFQGVQVKREPGA